MGILLLGASGFLESSRSSINVPGPDTWSYWAIDHTKQADSQWAPTGGGWTTFNLTQSVDANGWVNKDTSGGTTNPNTEQMGNGVRMPSTLDYAGAWIIKWTGNGTFQLNANGYPITWTVDNTTPLGNTTGTYTVTGGDTFTNVGGQNAVVVVKCSGFNGPMQIRIVQISTGPTPFATNLQFFRADDLTDYNAGLIFRRPFKQQYITLNPHSVRTLDWSGANETTVVRFDHRNIPTYASYFQNWGANGQPKYGVFSAPSSCQWTLASATGMPVSMQNGEQVTARTVFPNAPNGGMTIQGISVAANAVVTYDMATTTFTQYPLTRQMTVLSWAGGVATGTVPPFGGNTGHGLPVGATVVLTIAGCTPSGYNVTNAVCTVTSTTQFTYTIANPGVATVIGTAAGHGYPNGEKVLLLMRTSANNSTPAGMTQMDIQVATVASATATTFATGINSSGFSAFTQGYSVNNLTLNVGARGVFPVCLNDGNSPGLKYHGDTLSQGGYTCFTFDKNLTMNSGVTGCWVMNVNGGPLNPSCPPEIVTALVNELMLMNPTNPINLYITLPTLGMNSSDIDYVAAQNYAVNFIDIVLNPASTQRAVGFSSLNPLCKLYVEHANETWNPGPYTPTYYQAWRGFLANGGGGLDVSTQSSIRAVQTIKDIKAAFPAGSWPQLKYILGMWSIFGTTGDNAVRLNGNATITAALGSAATPLSYFDYANFAGYINNQSRVASATIQTAGSGGVNGTAVYQVSGGNGTPATLNVTISGGVLSAVNSVANPGSYDIYPATPAALTYVSGTGTGLSGATVNLVQTASGMETGVASFVAANGNAASEEAAYLAWINGFRYQALGGGATIEAYLGILTSLAVACVAQGKGVKGYEGGFEPSGNYIWGVDRFSVTNGSNIVSKASGYNVGDYVNGPGWPVNTKITINSGTQLTMNNNYTGPTNTNSFVVVGNPTSQFVNRARGSQSWATIHRTWFDGAVAIAGSIAPAEFITYFNNTNRWYHTFYQDTYLGGVENAGLDLDYIGQGNRNRGL